MSEWDTFDVSDGGPYQDDHYQDDSYQDLPYHDDPYHDDPYHGGPDDPVVDHGAAETSVLDHDPAAETLAASPDHAGHDPHDSHDPHDPLLSHPPVAPPTEQDTLSAESAWIYDHALGSESPGPDPTADDLFGSEGPNSWDSVVAPEVISGDPFTELINETEPIEPGTPLWDTVMNVLALPGPAGGGWLQPGPDEFGTSV
jgi:hypothetical protein